MHICNQQQQTPQLRLPERTMFMNTFADVIGQKCADMYSIECVRVLRTSKVERNRCFYIAIMVLFGSVHSYYY